MKGPTKLPDQEKRAENCAPSLRELRQVTGIRKVPAAKRHADQRGCLDDSKKPELLAELFAETLQDRPFGEQSRRGRGE